MKKLFVLALLVSVVLCAGSVEAEIGGGGGGGVPTLEQQVAKRVGIVCLQFHRFGDWRLAYEFFVDVRQEKMPTIKGLLPDTYWLAVCALEDDGTVVGRSGQVLFYGDTDIEIVPNVFVEVVIGMRMASHYAFRFKLKEIAKHLDENSRVIIRYWSDDLNRWESYETWAYYEQLPDGSYEWVAYAYLPIQFDGTNGTPDDFRDDARLIYENVELGQQALYLRFSSLDVIGTGSGGSVTVPDLPVETGGVIVSLELLGPDDD